MRINMDEFELKSKLRGFYKMPRELILDLFNKKITFDEFGLLMIYIAFADWDKRHKNYGRAYISDNQLNKIEGLSKFKVKLNKYKLYAERYLELTDGQNKQKVININNPDLYFKEYKEKVVKSKTTIYKSKPT